MQIYCIFGGSDFSGKLQNFIVLLRVLAPMLICCEVRLLPGLVLTPTNFQHLTNRLSQPRTKLYCSEISSKLFPDYYDRRTAKWTRSTVSFMCTVILTFPLILA
ncbi:hypothetical protein T09_13290, partial [Trichinella sp. T9]